MPKSFSLSEKHIAFCNMVASGIPAWQAYQKTVARPSTKTGACRTKSSLLLRRKEITETINKMKLDRINAISLAKANDIAEEFRTTLLTADQLDSFHSSVIRGLVTVEEVVPSFERFYDDKGRLIRRTKFVKVLRPPNVKEKQASADALYKRKGSYAAKKFLGAVFPFDKDNDDRAVQRVIILSNGEKINFNEITKTG